MTVQGVDIERRGRVGWILMNDYQETVEAADSDPDVVGVHQGIGQALDELRWDQSIEVVVLTGRNDGEFYRFSRRSHWDDPKYRGRLNPINHARQAASAPAGPPSRERRPDAHEMLMLIEKPVVARVNGDAIGFGQSLLWGCDLILAREDAKIAWGHTGMGEIVDSNGERRGFPWPMTPSYGMACLNFMPPTKAKAFLMLSTVYTGREMADMGAFNDAVPADELDAAVDPMVEALLARPPGVLAHTKRVCNKATMSTYNLTEDLSGAYGILDLWQAGARGDMDEPDPT